MKFLILVFKLSAKQILVISYSRDITMCLFLFKLPYRASPPPAPRLEPMLSRIASDRTSVVCPIIDAIDADTIALSGNGGYQTGGFTWSLHFTWLDKHQRKPTDADYVEPVR